MSRQYDIRVALVGAYQGITIADLCKMVGMMKALIKAQTETNIKEFNFEYPPFQSKKKKSFKLKIGLIPERNKIILNDKEYPITALMNFSSSLEVMAGPMGLGDRTFSTLFSSDYNGLKSLGLTENEIALINAHVYSGIMKRFYNLARPGSDAPYRFKVKLGIAERPIGFTIVDHTFQNNATVKYRIESNDDRLDKALNWFHEEYIPTPQAVSKLIAKRMKEGWSFTAGDIDEPMNVAKNFIKLVTSSIKTETTPMQVIEDFWKFVRSMEHHREYIINNQFEPINFVVDYGIWEFRKIDKETERSTKLYDMSFKPNGASNYFSVLNVCLNELHDGMNVLYSTTWKKHSFLTEQGWKSETGKFDEFLAKAGIFNPQAVIDLLTCQMERLTFEGATERYEEWGAEIKFEAISGDEFTAFKQPIVFTAVVINDGKVYYTDKVFLKSDVLKLMSKPKNDTKKPSLFKRLLSAFKK